MCHGGRHNTTHSWRETLTIVKASALVYSSIMRIKQPIMSKISMSYFPQIDLIVSCLITETHRLPLILPSCPEVSKGDDNDQPQSLQHTKEFLANGGSSGIEPPYWRILWGQLPLKSYQLGDSTLSTLSPVSLGLCTQPPMARERIFMQAGMMG